MRNLNLYLVAEGIVSAATAATEFDGVNSILVAALNAEQALQIAAAYDCGEVAAENMEWDGATIAVVRAPCAANAFLVHVEESTADSIVEKVRAELDALELRDVDFNGVDFCIVRDDYTWVDPPKGFDEYHASRLLSIVQAILAGGEL